MYPIAAETLWIGRIMHEIFEGFVFGVEPVQACSAAIYYPQISLVIFQKKGYIITTNTGPFFIIIPVNLKGVPIIFIQTIIGGKPKKSVTILNNMVYC
jgi:hypothetical protein